MLRVHTYVPAGFRHFPHESARNSCLDSSARNLAENHSGIVRKIRARPRGYPRPSALENRGIPRKNVSYPCQVPYSVPCRSQSHTPTSAVGTADCEEGTTCN